MADHTASIDDGTTRRLKKREHDRRAQRALRERTKNRIAHLEAQVEMLSQQDTDASKSILLQKLAETTKERDGLTELLTQISAMVEKYSGTEKTAKVDDEDLPKTLPDAGGLIEQHQTSRSKAPARGDETPRLSSTLCAKGTENHPTWCDDASLTNFNLREDSSPEMLLDSIVPSSTSIAQLDVVVCPTEGACECTPSTSSCGDGTSQLNIWRMANMLLGSQANLPKALLHYEDMMSEDVAVRAILESWDAVDAFVQLSPLWSKLRTIDQLQFCQLPKPERLAIMMTMHRLLRSQAEASDGDDANLPAYLRPRPCQTMIPHSSATNFFVWPGLRERFVFAEHRYCANSFWFHFVNNFRISWPYEFRDCFNRNRLDGKLSIGTEFLNCIADLRSWTMKSDFFQVFPELVGDIPVSDSVPTTLHDKRETDMRTLLNWTEARARNAAEPETPLWHGATYSDSNILGQSIPGAHPFIQHSVSSSHVVYNQLQA